MKISFRAALLVLALTGLTTTNADEGPFDEGRWYVSPMATWVYREDTARNTNTSFGAHLGLGRGLAKDWAYEVLAFGHSSDAGDETNQWGLGVDLLHSYSPWGNWSPYGLLGFGYIKTNIVEDPTSNFTGTRSDSDNPYGNVGFGLMRSVGSNELKFRSDIRYRIDMRDPNSYSDWLWNVGFLLPVGAPPVPPVVDADGDGVNDGADQCPGTPPGTPVDARGCELDADGDGVVNSKDDCPNTRSGARVDARGCELDADGDGVGDSIDRCPNTPRGTRVDANGCKVIGDADGDGVLDNRDRCPNTGKGVRVDVNGCEFTVEIKLPGVTFELDSAKLTPQSLTVLNDAADTLKKYPKVTVEAEGHTDSQGADAYNQRLSQRRAEAVRDYLVSRGAAAANITARGYGESQPVASNANAAGRAQNRRVTLRVTSK